MMTTLRTNRRTRRNAMFDLESLDDRIVLSAIGAEAHVAALIAAGHVKAAAVIERHEARIESMEARHAAKVADFEKIHTPSPFAPPPSSPGTPIVVNPPYTVFPQSSAVPTSTAPASTGTTAAPASMVSATTVTAPVTTTTTTATAPVTTTMTTAPVTSPTTSTSSASNTGTTAPLPPNVSSQLQSLYAQYESYLSTNSSGTFSPTGLNMLIIKGNDVGINFETSDSADFNTILGQLQSDGMQVNSSSSAYGVIEGMLPIAQLPAVAQLPSASVTPMYRPLMN